MAVGVARDARLYGLQGLCRVHRHDVIVVVVDPPEHAGGHGRGAGMMRVVSAAGAAGRGHVCCLSDMEGCEVRAMKMGEKACDALKALK